MPARINILLLKALSLKSAAKDLFHRSKKPPYKVAEAKGLDRLRTMQKRTGLS